MAKDFTLSSSPGEDRCSLHETVNQGILKNENVKAPSLWGPTLKSKSIISSKKPFFDFRKFELSSSLSF